MVVPLIHPRIVVQGIMVMNKEQLATSVHIQVLKVEIITVKLLPCLNEDVLWVGYMCICYTCTTFQRNVAGL